MLEREGEEGEEIGLNQPFLGSSFVSHRAHRIVVVPRSNRDFYGFRRLSSGVPVDGFPVWLAWFCGITGRRLEYVDTICGHIMPT